MTRGLPYESGNSCSIAVNTSDEITRIGNVLKYIHGHSPNINDRLKHANSVTPSRDRHADTQVTAEYACATVLSFRATETEICGLECITPRSRVILLPRDWPALGFLH